MNELFPQTLSTLESAFELLERQVQKPESLQRTGGLAFRYSEESIYQAIILKSARVVSGLHAAYCLWLNGFVQEQAVLQRVLDELNEDIVFLVYAVTNDEITPLHQRYLKAFYEEEFDETDNPIASTQKRDMVPRQKIRAYLSRVEGVAMNPSDGVELSRTISKTYSGFVHAASTHIMDMYGGNPPRFHLSGMLGTPRMKEYEEDLWNYFYRSILSFIGAAKAFGDEELVNDLYSFTEHFESVSGTTYQRDVRGET